MIAYRAVTWLTSHQLNLCLILTSLIFRSTSTINGIAYVPFMSVDLRERFAFPVPFSWVSFLLFHFSFLRLAALCQSWHMPFEVSHKQVKDPLYILNFTELFSSINTCSIEGPSILLKWGKKSYIPICQLFPHVWCGRYCGYFPISHLSCQTLINECRICLFWDTKRFLPMRLTCKLKQAQFGFIGRL